MWKLEPGYIDSHCHLSDSRVGADVAMFIARARERGVENFLLAGISPKDWQEQKALVARYSGIIPCFGLHPYWVNAHSREECEKALTELETNLSGSFALGELGLDFRADHTTRGHEHQTYFFLAQWRLALAHEKIPVLHIVRAHDQALRLLKKEASSPALVHAFDSSWKNAKAYLDLGFYLSIGGRLLQENNRALHEAVKDMPMERMLLESDAPDQPPPQLQDQKNEPWTIVLIAERVAELKGLCPEKVLEQTRENFQRLFKL